MFNYFICITCSHCTASVVMATTQVNGKSQNSTPRHAKSLNQCSPKLARVITSSTAPDMQNLVAIGSGVSAAQIRDFSVRLGRLVRFWGFFNLYERIFMRNTSKDVVTGKELLFGVPWTDLLFWPLHFRKTAIFRPIFSGQLFFGGQKPV